MHKIALATGVALALSVLVAPAALAGDTIDCDAQKRLVVTAQTRVDNRAAQERVEELAELNAAKVARNAAQVAVDKARAALDGAPGDAALKKALDAAKDTLEDAKADVDKAQAVLDADSRRLAELRAALTVATQSRDRVCGDVTTTPSTPPPADTDVDCDEVTDARAQEILDADKRDPNNLDDDGDGVACEEEVAIDDDEVVIPTGGVNTGGGPA
jgi:hypothetical protein